MANLSTVIKELKEYDGEPLVFMEVCGTHTAAISENGIPDIISDKIRLVSGPGCPVCVTVAAYIDKLIQLSKRENYCVVTFGDMIRVMGSSESLRAASADGGRVEMVYSPLDVLKLAKAETETVFVFAAVGFETTTPAYALLIEELENNNIQNVRLLTALKTMPAVIEKICEEANNIAGFIAPGHVSVITGSGPYQTLSQKTGLPYVISGFSGEELLISIAALIKIHNTPRVINMYPMAVTEEGNEIARKKVSQYFEPCDAAWRGLGIIANSGMRLRREYLKYDAGSEGLTEDFLYNEACSCPQVITGKIAPTQCPLFGKACTPEVPKGACMVSTEGSCFNYFVNGRC